MEIELEGLKMKLSVQKLLALDPPLSGQLVTVGPSPITLPGPSWTPPVPSFWFVLSYIAGEGREWGNVLA